MTEQKFNVPEPIEVKPPEPRGLIAFSAAELLIKADSLQDKELKTKNQLAKLEQDAAELRAQLVQIQQNQNALRIVAALIEKAK